MLRTLLISLLALFCGALMLIYLGASTLFLSALLIAIIAPKSQKGVAILDKAVGVWFALSVAPAFGVKIDEIANIENGFLVQSLLSLAFFLYFYIQKPSIIERLSKSQKQSLGVILSSTIAGFAGGILSALTWQLSLKAMEFFG